MSMNLHLRASREIVVVRTGKKDTQVVTCSLCQTPTKVSYSVKEKETFEEQLKAYYDWVLETFDDEKIPVYAEDDVFCEREPVGYEMINRGKDHIQEVDDWVKEVIKEGYTPELIII